MDKRCSNPGHDDRWTCPSCLKDLPDVSPGLAHCGCGARVKLIIESQPVCTAIVAGSGDHVAGCEDCGEEDFIPNVEAWETLDQILCDDCAPAALEEAAEDA